MEKTMNRAKTAPISRDLALEALQETVRWPNAAPRTILTLAAPACGRRA